MFQEGDLDLRISIIFGINTHSLSMTWVDEGKIQTNVYGKHFNNLEKKYLVLLINYEELL